MKVNPSLTGLTDWIEGQVIDVEHNPFMGLVISIKDNGRIANVWQGATSARAIRQFANGLY